MNKIFENKKQLLIGLLIVSIVLQFLSFIFTIVYYSSYSYYDWSYYFAEVLNLIFVVFLFSLALYFVIKGIAFWSKILFVVFFSYVLMSNLFTVCNSFLSVSYSCDSAILTLYWLCTLIDAMLVIAIGVIYLLQLGNIIKNQNLVDIMIYLRLAFIFVNFIIGIIAIADGSISWHLIISYFISAVITLIFFVAIKYRKNEPIQIEDNK